MLVSLAVLLAACSKMEDTFGEFAKNPETIYVGTPDTLIAQSGYEKLRLAIVINADPKIAKGEIRIGNDTIPQKFNIVRKYSNVDTTYVDMEMPEGSYRLSVTLLDENGNKSLVKSVLANVLGESYVKTLGVKTITAVQFTKSSDPSKTGALVTFGSNFENLSAVRLKFKDSKGLPVETIVDRFVPSIILSDFQAGGDVIAESIYFPVNPFYEFKATGNATAKLPACNQLSVGDVTASTVQFVETETQKTSIQSFVVTSKGCVLGAVTLTTTAPFALATTANGDFKNSISLDSIAKSRTVFVSFKPVSSKDSLYTGKINIEATNILNAPLVQLSAKEKAVKK